MLRARIVLACAEGETNVAVAERLRVMPQTAGKWRQRFIDLDGLLDEPRPGAPRRIGDDQIEALIVKTLEQRPRDATHWSTRAMAAASGLSQSTVSRVWRAFGLQPHRVERWKLSSDRQCVEKVRDIVGLYLNPPDRALVLCVDEQSQIQAIDRSQPIFPLLPRTPERRTHDYFRHRAIEFRRFLATIDRELPAALELHLIFDNYATHKTPAVRRRLAAHPRFHLHFTPTGASWLNLVERWFAEITRRQIKRGAHRSTRQLEEAIRSYLALYNDAPRPSSGRRAPMKS